MELLEFSSTIYTNHHSILAHHLHNEFLFTDSVFEWFLSSHSNEVTYFLLSSNCSAFAYVYLCVLLGSIHIFHSMQSWMCVLKAWTTVKMVKLSNNKTDSCLSPHIFISDGFQSIQHRSTFATFFDYSRAYDHAWKTCLHMKISKISVTSH